MTNKDEDIDFMAVQNRPEYTEKQRRDAMLAEKCYADAIIEEEMLRKGGMANE